MLSKAESLQALKSMKPGKTPGLDSLPTGFYKSFWNKSIQYAYTEDKFWISQRCGIIIVVSSAYWPFLILVPRAVIPFISFLFLVFHWLILLRKGWKYKEQGANLAWQGWSNCLHIRHYGRSFLCYGSTIQSSSLTFSIQLCQTCAVWKIRKRQQSGNVGSSSVVY